MRTPETFQSAIQGLTSQAKWDGLSRETIAAILAAQAEVAKHSK
jgi:hypothetical protein